MLILTTETTLYFVRFLKRKFTSFAGFAVMRRRKTQESDFFFFPYSLIILMVTKDVDISYLALNRFKTFLRRSVISYLQMCEPRILKWSDHLKRRRKPLCPVWERSRFLELLDFPLNRLPALTRGASPVLSARGCDVEDGASRMEILMTVSKFASFCTMVSVRQSRLAFTLAI